MEKKEKKKMSKGTKVLLIIVCILVGLALIMAATVLILSARGHRQLTDDGSSMNVGEKTENTGTIRYNGKLYRYNDEITTILMIGVDDYSKNPDGESYGSGNQSDVNVLAVLDPKNGKMTMMALSRDVMCDFDILDENGEYAGVGHSQLALSYSYGDGGNRSCELTRDAVSKIFYGLNIPAYGSIYLKGVGDLVDAVGGVTITPAINIAGCTAGVTTTLNGDMAQKYIRYRSGTIEGNNERMDRQKQVMLALVDKAVSAAKADPTSVLDMYKSAKDDVSTNLNASMMVYLAQLATKLSFDGEIHKVPGHSVLGTRNHAEFVIDEDAFFQMILDTFYMEVDE